MNVSCAPKCLGASRSQRIVLLLSLCSWGSIFSLCSKGKQPGSTWSRAIAPTQSCVVILVLLLCRDLCWPQGTKDQGSSGHKRLLPSESVSVQALLQTAGTMTLLRVVRQNYLSGLKSDLVPRDPWSLLIAALSPFP